MFKVSYKLPEVIEIPEPRQWRCTGVFIVNLKHVSPFTAGFILLGLERWMSAGVSVQPNREVTNCNID